MTHFLRTLWILGTTSLMLVGSLPVSAQIVIQPAAYTGPLVQRWGWDLKGSSGLTDTMAEAQIHYGDVAANLVRIPIRANAHFSDGRVDTSEYSTMLTSLRNIKVVNPEVQVFASLKLSGATTFVGPASESTWITQGTAAWPLNPTGRIFGNTVDRPNPEFYHRLVADFFSYMDEQGVQIDYLGLNNETEGALDVNRYIETVDLLRGELEDRAFDVEELQFIAPDSFGPNTAINQIESLTENGRGDAFDIVGSHYYPERNSHTRDKWVSMSVESSGADLWFTEAHINPSNSNNGSPASNNITRMRRGMGMVFSANSAGGGAVDVQGDLIGADSFVWWQGGGSISSIDDTLKREIANSMIDAHPIMTTPGFDEQDSDPNAPLYQAYQQGNRVTLWLANPGAEQFDLNIDLLGARFVDNDHRPLTSEYWQGCSNPPLDCTDNGNEIAPDTTGVLSLHTPSWKTDLSIDLLPENSIAKLEFYLAGNGDLNDDGILNESDVDQFINGWQLDSAAGDLDWDGDTDRQDWFYFRAAFQDAGQLELLRGASVPEPATRGWILFVGIALFMNARGRRQAAR